MNDITLKQAYDLFMFDRETYCQLSTCNDYKWFLNLFFQFLEMQKEISINDLKISDISVVDLNQYVAYLRKRNTLTLRTIKTYSVHTKAFFKFLYNEEYIADDITKKFKIMKPEKKLVIPLSVLEVQRVDNLYNTKTFSGSRNLSMIHLMLDCGLRCSEICNLAMNDIDFQSGLIFIRSGKGLKDRVLPLPVKVRKYLYLYITVYRPSDSVCHTDYVFMSRSLKILARSTISALFARIKTSANIERIYPHLLRHTFATSYILGGGDLESLRIYMGHTDIATTQKYLHIANSYKFNAGNIYQLDKLYFKRYY